MTKIGRIYEEQKLAYGKEMAEQATEKTRIDTMYDMAVNLIKSSKCSMIQALDNLGIIGDDREILMKRFK